MGKYLDILNLDNRTGWPKQFVRYSAGAVILDVSAKQFEYLARKIHENYRECIYKPKKIEWVDMAVVEEYILQHPLEK